jgi:selenide,water dikinase
VESACIPGACFRNLDYVEEHCNFENTLGYNDKMLMLDAQTSGGLLICCSSRTASGLLDELTRSGYPDTTVIGEVQKKADKYICFQ